ncbi:hypothetical protein [Streptomyces beijiangensis]|uniref:Secreted protein n=1 Tax=Streptomyces beijiangensis TaxID=163361 RepID=A0A939F6Y1_9ACTN|nr:hypothetical protein [Streptomyces beijiangensis]MBO0512684.1 hypothetical protein [Streptomyces beijiangensis]
MCTTRVMAAAALAAAALLTTAGPAAADSPSPSPSVSGSSSAPTQAGTSFRTAAVLQQDQPGTADASTGDYLYWVFPADAGQTPTVRATVTLPEAATRHGAATWQVDVYDGLRRRQACTHGSQTRTAAADAASVELKCTLRPVRAWSEPWANDPLPGSYYVRLTVTGLPDEDLGLPVHAEAEATAADAGGAHAVDGTLAAPLVPGTATAATAAAPSDDGWSSGWWTDRWLWTVGGGVLASLAAIGGYALTRGTGRRPVRA